MPDTTWEKLRVLPLLLLLAQATLAQGNATEPALIPITIRHGKLHLAGRINDSEVLDLVFDTGADIHVLYPSGIDKGAEIRLDGTQENAGTGGTTLRQTSSDNRLEVAGLRWEHEPVLYVEKQADAADGILGYPVFRDHVVEFDHVRGLLIVHDTLPGYAVEFEKTPMPFVGSLTPVEAVLGNGASRASGMFVLDTGGTGTLMVNQAFAAAHGLRGSLRVLGTSTSRGVGPAAIQNEVALLPQLTLAGFTLTDVPIHVELPSDGNRAAPGGALCMQVLERFDAILDYPGQAAYFRPNARFTAPFELRSGPPTFVRVGLALLVLAALAGLAWRARRRRRPLGPESSRQKGS